MTMMTTDFGYRPALNNAQLNFFAPSIFATSPDAEVSDRYKFIPTIDVVDGLRDAGWLPVQAKQTKVNKVGNKDKTLHMIRFRNPDLNPIGSDQIFPEVIMTNSHDRTSAFKFLTGLFRMICSNGLCVSDAQFGSVNVRHNSKSIDESIAAAFSMLENVPTIVNEIDRFKQIELSPMQQEIFAKSALNFKYGVHGDQIEDPVKVVYASPTDFKVAARNAAEGEIVKYVPVKPKQLLVANRSEDGSGNRQYVQGRGYRNTAKSDLWTTYNVIQENVIKGGAKGFSPSGRRSSTRQVASISEDVKINKALWSMAAFMANKLDPVAA